MIKWSYELNEFELEYRPRTAIKAQVLADFLMEYDPEEEKKNNDPREWTMFVDGSATTSQAGGRVVLKGPEGEEMLFAIKYEEVISNNETEYETLLVGLNLAREAGADAIDVKSDSQLVVEQVTGGFEAQTPEMKKLKEEVLRRMAHFIRCRLSQIPRRENSKADELARMGSYLSDIRTQHVTLLAVRPEGRTRERNPKANGQTEVSNRIILQNIKAKLGQHKRGWLEELPGVLWAYRTTARASSGETPFSLVYGSEALIPTEVVEPTVRVVRYEESNNQKERHLDLDLLDEKRFAAKVRLENYKKKMIKRYNSMVKERPLQIGDLVLRKVEVQRPVGKLEPKWEGPYRVRAIQREGTYELETLEGAKVPRTWTIHNLKKFNC
ncbi:UNVERIFIED_CONTAM: hypothetical protein Slati_4466400 [Sesamum latifolium]|uniref:RNase H type-1 domain-containing protein n=1 Tax=Sesamum latifolium TaxID=2727402 RepID=A0AAW2SS81_9LAMI